MTIMLTQQSNTETNGILIDDASVYIRIEQENDTMAHRYEIPLQKLLSGINFNNHGENFTLKIFCEIKNCTPVRVQKISS